MRLHSEDKALFGQCPAWDEFYLVVCEECGKVIKPQAFKHHIELRHSRSATVESCGSPQVSESSNGVKDKSSDTNAQRTTKSGKTLLKEQVKIIPDKDQSGKEPLASVKVKLIRTNSGGQVGQVIKDTPSSSQNQENEEENASQIGHSSSSSSLSASAQSKQASLNAISCAAVSLLPSLVEGGGGGGNAGGSAKRPPSLAIVPSAPPAKRKFLPCKDREYDPNKHCGVVFPDTGKPCTRSLTCKSHSLSLRRAVTGRRKSFDDLLAEHRACKEIKPGQTSASPSLGGVVGGVSVAGGGVAGVRPPQTPSPSSPIVSGPSPLSVIPPTISNNTQQQTLLSSQDGKLPLSTMVRPLAPPAAAPKCSGPPSMFDPSSPCAQPRPAAMCTFGVRVLANNLLVLDRKWDATRNALASGIVPQGALSSLGSLSGQQTSLLMNRHNLIVNTSVTGGGNQLRKKTLTTVVATAGSQGKKLVPITAAMATATGHTIQANQLSQLGDQLSSGQRVEVDGGTITVSGGSSIPLHSHTVTVQNVASNVTLGGQCGSSLHSVMAKQNGSITPIRLQLMRPS